MKKYLFFPVTIFVSLFFISFSNFTKSPHLIVGCWQMQENSVQGDVLKKNYKLNQCYFSSDELTCDFLLKNDKNEARCYFAFKVIDSIPGFDKSVLLIKEVCENPLRMVFSIQELTKSKLKLHFEKAESSKSILFEPTDIELERTAGPSENME